MTIRKLGWVAAGLAVVALWTVSGQRPANTNKNTAVDDDKRNAGPQKQYPKFTLAAQKQAMQRMAAMRRKNRVAGLRDKIPPADWISMGYHGLVLDANLDPITMDAATVSKIQESMFSILKGPAQEKLIKRYKNDLSELFNQKTLKVRERLIVRHGVLGALLAESDEKLRASYEWRHKLLRKGVFTQARIAPSVRDLFRKFDLDWSLIEPVTVQVAYVPGCRMQGVPIPPDWPDPQWISQGPLTLVFISQSLNAEVFAYRDPAVPGVCFALPRKNALGSIQLLGIICQSQTTGHACFWDNKTTSDVPITGPNINLDIDTIGNGYTLGENCTNCHRGENVFTIHPGSALQLSAPYDTTAAIWPTPHGQSTWQDPGPLVMPVPSGNQNSCVACHQFPNTVSDYCNAVLQSAAMNTMPPYVAPAGWPGTSVPVRRKYSDHINFLSTCP